MHRRLAPTLLALSLMTLLLLTAWPTVMAVGLGSLVLTALDGDGDGLQDQVKVEQQVLCDSGGTYNVTARLYPPSVDFQDSPDSYVDIAWWSQTWTSCTGSFIVSLYLEATTANPEGMYNVTVRLTHTSATPDPNSTQGQVYLYPRRLTDLEMRVDAALLEAEPGASVTVGLTLTNRGNLPDTFDLTASSTSNWSVSVDPLWVDVPTGQSSRANLTVLVPASAALETTERVQILASSRTNVSYTRAVYLDVQVGMADLMIFSDDVTFSKANPMAGEIVKVRVTVRNGGSKDASDVVVALYEGDEIIGTRAISLLPKGQSATVEIPWRATFGDHVLKLVVDPDSQIRDMDTSNNVVEKSVSVMASPDGGGPGGYSWLLWIGIVVGGLILAVLLVATGTIRLPGQRVIHQAPMAFGTTIQKPPTADDLSPAHAYLLEEDKPVHSLKLYSDLARRRSGLIITRVNPKRLLEQGLEATRLMWLTDRATASGSYDVVPPSLERLMYATEVHLKEHPDAVLMIDGVEYLVDNNNFNAVLRFLRRLVDLVSQSEAILIVSVSPRALGERELRILEREMEVFRIA